MLLIDQYKHIRKRDDFIPAVDKAIQITSAQLKAAPGFGIAQAILMQLEAIRGWTANGREPTKDERRKPQIGVMLSREMPVPPTDELEEWSDICGEVESYFQDWLDDETFQTVDEAELSDFPLDDDDD